MVIIKTVLSIIAGQGLAGEAVDFYGIAYALSLSVVLRTPDL